jgi:hypothetical protein
MQVYQRWLQDVLSCESLDFDADKLTAAGASVYGHIDS